MRPATVISADGPLNLLNAIRTASSPEARGKGVLAVLNDEINAAREVTKTNTYRVETFRSPDFGYLGYVDGDKVAFYRSSIKRHTVNSEFDVSGLQDLPPVEIVDSYVQPSPLMIRALVTGGVKGIVFAGTGAGLLSKSETSTVSVVLGPDVATRPVMVRSNRTGSGRVVSYPEYEKMGMIPADTLKSTESPDSLDACTHKNAGSLVRSVACFRSVETYESHGILTDFAGVMRPKSECPAPANLSPVAISASGIPLG